MFCHLSTRSLPYALPIFRWLPVHVRWKRKGNDCILCFFTSFLTIFKRKKIFIFIFKLAENSPARGNEISPSPDGRGLKRNTPHSWKGNEKDGKERQKDNADEERTNLFAESKSEGHGQDTEADLPPRPAAKSHKDLTKKEQEGGWKKTLSWPRTQEHKRQDIRLNKRHGLGDRLELTNTISHGQRT